MKFSTVSRRLRNLLHSGRRRILRYRSRLASVLNTVPHRIAARDESRRAHAGTIADLFASIMCQVVDIGVDKLDTALLPWRWLQQDVQKKNGFRLRWKCMRFCSASAVT